MKKFASLLLAGALSLSLLAVGTSAAGDVIKRGTAVVDGQLDPAYTGSLVIELSAEAGEYSHHSWEGTASATTYYMYDDQNLYLFADVIDDEVLSAGEEVATDPSGVVNEYNDAIRWRLSFDVSNNTVKFAVDAYNLNIFGLPSHYDLIDYDEVLYTAVITDDGYHVEMAIPCSKGMTDMISAGKLGISFELSDLNEEGNTYFHAWAAPGQDYNIPVFFDLSDEVAVAVETPATDTPADDTPATDTPADDTPVADTPADDTPADDTPATDVPADDTPATDVPSAGADEPATTDKPTTNTFDPMLATLAVTVASGAAYIVISKSKKH